MRMYLLKLTSEQVNRDRTKAYLSLVNRDGAVKSDLLASR